MPPTRRARTSTGPAAKGAQKTLSFGSSKISKSATKDKLASPSPSSSTTKPTISPIDIEPGHVTSEVAISEQAVDVKAEVSLSPEEEKARKVTDAQIRRYWRDREAERRAPRVHQGDLSIEEKILRLWDMSSQFGPAIGIARMKRWVRANKLGLAPPIEVLAVLLKEGEKGNSKIERAYVDELMSSKYVIGEA
ncbi:DNA polymerase delta subunit p12 [Hyphodiscus hymeniophilus]|uniref:DNA polymerase delta subunit p12 n=1 Tax=Hyphodiscus hymeniophilus TaxID=353542 RepID=A0A9P6VQG7_9HELO|nr:DNA polymerase delta subunit p12 [Hyphodiscus hymeniophilus]